MITLLRLARFGLHHKQYLILAWISLIGSNLLALTVPWLIGNAVDHTLTERDRAQLLWLAALILFLSVTRGIFAYGQQYYSEAVAARVAFFIRNTLLRKMQILSFGFHDRRKTGDLMSVVTYDVESTRMFINFGLVRSLQLLTLIGGAIPLLMIVHWQLALITFAGIPLTIYTTATVGGKMRKIWDSVHRRMADLATVLQENLTGMKVVKVFGADEHQKDRFRQHSSLVAEETFSANRLRVSNSAFLTFVYICATGLAILFGGRWVIEGELTAGELTQFLLYLGLLVMPVRMLGMAVSTFSRAISSGERIFSIVDSESPVANKVGAVELKDVKGAVRFKGVSFRYNPSAPALEHIDFQVNPGEKVAILGASGSGKSTIVNLIPRFYDATGGSVTIDGFDVRDVTLSSLRDNVGMVFQDVFLFHTTIRENLSYGANGVTDTQIEEAAKAAQLHDHIASLPDGYDTIVGERGSTLSGGQRQRLAIARTLLVNPPVLILDDSTASVDVETEALIRKALTQVMENRTTFIIAHRVSSVKEANFILVLKDGAVVERGSHDELITRDGFYKQIYELQLLPSEEILLEAAIPDEGG